LPPIRFQGRPWFDAGTARREREERRSSISSVIDMGFFLYQRQLVAWQLAIEKKMCAGQAVE